MPLFGNKKKSGEQLRTLTEKEIQSKLYGHLRPEGVISGERATPPTGVRHLSGPDPKSAAQGHSGGVSSSAPSQSHFLSSQQGPFAQQKQTSAEEISTPASTTASPAPSVLEKSPSQHERSPQWLNREDKLAEKKWGADPWSRAKEKRESRESVTWQAKGLSSILSVLISLIRMGGRLIQLLGNVCLRFLLSIDFRKPRVLRAAYWLTALGLLAAVFIGIHILNLRREVAMNQAPRLAKDSNPARKPKVYQSLFPSLTVLPMADPQSAKQESGGQANEPVGSKENERKIDNEAQKGSTESAASGPQSNISSVPLTREKVDEEASQKGIVIQVATFAMEQDAQKLASRLKQEQLRSFVRSLSRQGGRAYYCVFIGNFKTHREAEAMLGEFRKREIAKSFKDAFIRSL